MAVSRRRAWAYVEELLARPTRQVRVTLRHTRNGLTLLHRGRVLTRCYPTLPGRMSAPLVAEALGVELPPQGGQVEAVVSTGVLYRAVALASLDLRRWEALPLAERLLEEAHHQRQRGAEAPPSP